MYCGNCTSPIGQGDKFCGSCGVPIAWQSAPMQQQSMVQGQPLPPVSEQQTPPAQQGAADQQLPPIA